MMLDVASVAGALRGMPGGGLRVPVEGGAARVAGPVAMSSIQFSTCNFVTPLHVDTFPQHQLLHLSLIMAASAESLVIHTGTTPNGKKVRLATQAVRAHEQSMSTIGMSLSVM